jgi:hypothetical protein
MLSKKGLFDSEGWHVNKRYERHVRIIPLMKKFVSKLPGEYNRVQRPDL